MLRAISIAILITSSASAGEIVWRSPTSDTLATISEPALPTKPQQPSAGIHYKPVSVSIGASVVIKSIGNVTGFKFSVSQPLRETTISLFARQRTGITLIWCCH